MPFGIMFMLCFCFFIGVGSITMLCVRAYYNTKDNRQDNLLVLVLVATFTLAFSVAYLSYYTKASDALTPDSGISKIYLIEKSGCSDCINAELNGDIDYAKSLMTKLYESNSIDSIVYIENVSSKDDLVQVGYVNDKGIPIDDLSYKDYLEYTGVTWVPSIVVVNSEGQTFELDWDEENGWPDDMSAKILNFL